MTGTNTTLRQIPVAVVVPDAASGSAGSPGLRNTPATENPHLVFANLSTEQEQALRGAFAD